MNIAIHDMGRLPEIPWWNAIAYVGYTAFQPSRKFGHPN